ncbi:MAG: hypothetical protein ACOC6O_02975 [Chloroflexota bacterium]
MHVSPCVFLTSGPCGRSKSTINIDMGADNNRTMMEPPKYHDVGNGEAVIFADPNFERATRKALGKARGRVYPSDLARLTGPGFELCFGQISDISPLIYFPRLTWLNLTNNQGSGISRSCLGILMMFRTPRPVRRCCWSLSKYLTMLLWRRRRIR